MLFTEKMKEEGYTILVPQMSPIHFDLLLPALRSAGYNMVIPDNDTKTAVDTGLKYVNNDACYPSIIVVGQLMNAIDSGDYDLNKLAIMITQTGGGCRASNYISFIRRALDRKGLGNIPVISLNANGMETNPGFHYDAKMVIRAAQALIITGDCAICLQDVMFQSFLREVLITKGKTGTPARERI